ncbi:MAG: DUF6261 family protein [Odoribacteraceae bacterium]|jgi:hypothetical protein|nr:DUF6261 family protein [Odoribacteraceae bacterium]
MKSCFSRSPLIRVDLHSLSNEVFARFFADVISYIDKYDAEDIGIKQASNDLKNSYEKVKSALDVVRKSGFTEKLRSLDKLRDELCRGLSMMIKSIINIPDENKRDAARELNIIFDNYWSIPKRSYDAETEAIIDLFRELDLPENVARVTLLGLTVGVEQFRAINTDFITLTRQRLDQNTQRRGVSMKESREEVQEKFDLMIYRLEGLIALNGLESPGELSGFIKDYNTVARHYKNVLAIERGRRRAAKEKNEKDDPDLDNNENKNNNPPSAPPERG